MALMVLREGLWLALVGIMTGLGAAVAMSRGLSSLLYGVGPMDPIGFVVACAVRPQNPQVSRR